MNIHQASGFYVHACSELEGDVESNIVNLVDL